MLEAVRACSVSWAVTPPTAPKTSPVSAVATPRAIEVAASIPVPTRASVVTVPTARLARATVNRAAAAGAKRPTGRARTTSRRPDSSSARVCRTTMRMLMIAEARKT